MFKLIYFVRKLLLQLSLPLGLTILLFSYGLIKNKKKYLFSSLILIYFSSINIVADSLMKIVEYKPEYQKFIQGKSIIVLSGGIIKSTPILNNSYEWNDPDRFFAGIDLYKEDKSRKLVFTGGINPFQNNGISEGELLKKQSNIFINDPKNIIVTDLASNTIEESKQIKKLILNSQIPNDIILVTSAFHMKRAIKIFEKEGIKVNPFPVDFRTDDINFVRKIKNPLNWVPNTYSLNKTSIALKEIYGILIYKFI